MRNNIITSGTRAFQKLPVDNQDGKGAMWQGQREPRGRSLGGEGRQVVKFGCDSKGSGALSAREHTTRSLWPPHGGRQSSGPVRSEDLFGVQAGRGHFGPGHPAGLEFSSHHCLPARRQQGALA